MVVCLERGADLHTAQPLSISSFSKIQIGFTFLVPAHLGSPGKRVVKRLCVCACHAGAPLLLIDISCLQGTQQQTRHTLLRLSIHGTDRRTDARPFNKPCSAGSVNDLIHSKTTHHTVQRLLHVLQSMHCIHSRSRSYVVCHNDCRYNCTRLECLSAASSIATKSNQAHQQPYLKQKSMY